MNFKEAFRLMKEGEKLNYHIGVVIGDGMKKKKQL